MSWPTPGQPGGVVLSTAGEPVVATPSGLAILDRTTGRTDLRVPIEKETPENRANDIKVDYEDPNSRTVAAEFVTPSISSNGDAEVYGPYYGPMIRFNPHIRFFDGDRHGSMRAKLRRSHLEIDWRIADRVGDPNAPVRTLKTFTVESGRPGVAQY